MPRRSVLSSAEKESLLSWPEDPAQRVRLYTLSATDRATIRERRGDANRLGFAVQLCAMRYPGVTLGAGQMPPWWLLEHLGSQLAVSPDSWLDYSQRAATRREHAADLQSLYGFSSFSRAHARATLDSLIPVTWHSDQGIVVARALVEYLRQERVLLPPIPAIERLCAQAITQGEQRIYRALCDSLPPEQHEKLELLLQVMPTTQMTHLRWLSQPPGAPNPKQVLEHIERLRFIDGLNLPSAIGHDLARHRFLKIARQGLQMSSADLARFETRRRVATLIAVVVQSRATILDETVELHDRIMGAAFNRAKRTQEQHWGQSGKAINDKVRLYAQIGQTLLDAREKGRDAYDAIEAVMPWETFEQSVAQARQLAWPAEFDTLPRLIESYAAIHRYAGAWLEALPFQGAPASQELIEGVELLRDLNRRGARKMPETAPLGFVRKRWRALVCSSDGGFSQGIDRRFYELCLLSELKNALRSGDVWISGSRAFKEFDEYLLPVSQFEELQKQDVLPLRVEINVDAYLHGRLAHLGAELKTVERLAKKGALPDARFEASGLKLTPLTNAVPEEAQELMRRASALLPRTKITDLLLEVEAWTGFTRHFTHLGNGQIPSNSSLLLAALLSDGLNLGLSKMAQATPEISATQLSWLCAWHIRDETYSAALAELVNAQSSQPLAALWGGGTTSSSDGQRFKAGSHATSSGQINPKYGSEPGRLFYTHISDQYAPFHTNVINTNVRDATYVLDGLLQHESHLCLEEHYTDTAGFTDHVFALMHLLGFKFAPRIRDLADKKLYLPDPRGSTKPNTNRGSATHSYTTIDSLCAGPLNLRLIRAHWSEMLRLGTSIAVGTTSASLLLRKLGAYPRQNGLALALRELGRLERSLFMLQWLQDTELRRRVHVGLNKGEARNALARAVFFHRLGEVRDRSFENQRHRASGLNLLCVAIILWNTVYLQRAINALRAQTPDLDETLLTHLSPLGWEHINLTGDYSWNSSALPKPGHFRPLRSSAIY